MAKKALIGIHSRFINAAELYARGMGYEVDQVEEFEGMKRLAQAGQYQRYFMDVNLGRPSEIYIIPAQEILKIIRPQLDEGLAKFLSLSGNPRAVSFARENGVPCEDIGRLDLRSFFGD